MTDPFTKLNNLDELAWLTEQYVLGDLDEASCELLEARFAEDHAAREALANAVALLSATTIACSSQPATRLAPRVAMADATGKSAADQEVIPGGRRGRIVGGISSSGD